MSYDDISSTFKLILTYELVLYYILIVSIRLQAKVTKFLNKILSIRFVFYCFFLSCGPRLPLLNVVSYIHWPHSFFYTFFISILRDVVRAHCYNFKYLWNDRSQLTVVQLSYWDYKFIYLIYSYYNIACIIVALTKSSYAEICRFVWR